MGEYDINISFILVILVLYTVCLMIPFTPVIACTWCRHRGLPGAYSLQHQERKPVNP